MLEQLHITSVRRKRCFFSTNIPSMAIKTTIFLFVLEKLTHFRNLRQCIIDCTGTSTLNCHNVSTRGKSYPMISTNTVHILAEYPHIHSSPKPKLHTNPLATIQPKNLIDIRHHHTSIEPKVSPNHHIPQKRQSAFHFFYSPPSSFFFFVSHCAKVQAWMLNAWIISIPNPASFNTFCTLRCL